MFVCYVREMDVHDLPQATVEHNFYAGFSLLERQHSVKTSLRTLRGVFRNLGLRRRGQPVDIDSVRNQIREEMDGPGCLKGYRLMWHLLRIKHNIQVPRRYVAHLLHGYDKLKPYGLPIHGSNDGYSRKILWLKVVCSNNSPVVPLTLFTNCLKEIGGCPSLLRSDQGTENGLMAAVRCYLQVEDDDAFSGENAHCYGSSPKNQRIECWWSVVRCSCSSWWINLFRELSPDVDNKLHHKLIWFCFSGVLQDFLDEVKNHWNTHRIRKSRYGTFRGIPDALYSLPEEYNATECKRSITDFQKIRDIREFIQDNDENDDNIYEEYVAYLTSMYQLRQPQSIGNAIEQYKGLISIL